MSVATYGGPAPELSVAPEPLPPPSAPSFTEALDAAYEDATLASVAAPSKALLRQLQHEAAERPAFFPSARWDERAEHVIDAVEALPTHGGVLDPSATGDIARLSHLKEAITSFGPWTGVPRKDARQVGRLVEADHLVARLWLRAVEGYGADQTLVPEDAQGMRVRLLRALVSWVDTEALVRTLPPPQTQYHAMVEALSRYRGLEEEGFIALPKGIRKARPGKAHADLPTLRARLAQEDPLGAGEGETWDDALTEALRRARRAYQLKPKRKARYLIDKALLKALAVPLSERMASLTLNLGRWHRTDLRHFPYVIYVNLPDYHGEVWDGDERLLRFKVVIGDTRKKRGFMINATPPLTSAVDTIVYNPFWTVPKRIYEEELLVKAEEYEAEQAERQGSEGASAEPAPNYWESRGYEVFGEDSPSGRVWVRRKPGPGNALGKVKFLFENRWSVFLHDTPQKRKFRHTRRAFSHGCVRVHEPLVLAELLLTRDGQWPEVEAAKIMKHYKRKAFDMRTPVWLVVDYLTARVDDEGRVHFFPDIYKKDDRVDPGN